MRRVVESDNLDIGYDSFLDVVCNLIGILVILIMVIGVRAKEMWTKAAADQSAATSQLPVDAPNVDVETPKLATERLEAHLWQVQQQTEQLEDAIQQKRARRDQLQLLVTAARDEKLRQQKSLSEEARQQSERQQRLESARQRLDEVTRQVHLTTHAPQAPDALTHYPTPLARTVFGREEHFRLLDGRISYVPLNTLIAQLKDEAPHKVWKLKEATQITETIGPIDGFSLKYTLQQKETMIRTSAGTMRQTAVELARFVLVPVVDMPGPTLREALAENSDFQRRLAPLNPQEVTITVWTYPDSFEEYRRLQSYLHERGFQTAARPLPHGLPIAGSPSGSKSAAE